MTEERLNGGRRTFPISLSQTLWSKLRREMRRGVTQGIKIHVCGLRNPLQKREQLQTHPFETFLTEKGFPIGIPSDNSPFPPLSPFSPSGDDKKSLHFLPPLSFHLLLPGAEMELGTVVEDLATTLPRGFSPTSSSVSVHCSMTPSRRQFHLNIWVLRP